MKEERSSPVIVLHKLLDSSESFPSLPRPMAPSRPHGLHQRKLSDSSIKDGPEKPRPAREEVVWGKTPDGQGKQAFSEHFLCKDFTDYADT